MPYRFETGKTVSLLQKNAELGIGLITPPQNIFTLLSATRTVLKHSNKSLNRAIEMLQDKRNSAIQLVARSKIFL